MPINLLTWLHLIAMAFFVGGQLVLVAAIVPVLRDVNGGEQMRAVARRFGYGTLVALGVLLLTGGAMASKLQLWSAWQVHAKLGLLVLMGVLILIHMKKPKLHVIDALLFVASLSVVWLGVSLAG